MLVLTRKKNESLSIAEGLIRVTIVEVRGSKVRIGIDAPKDINVKRSEIEDKEKSGG